jgi:hypothetical protein
MRAAKTIFIFAVCCYLAGSCTCQSPEPAPDYFAYLYFENSKGDDLLNPSTPGHFITDSITVNGFHAGTYYDFRITNSPNLSPDRNPPKGYSCALALLRGKTSDIIILNRNTVDTLSWTFSGTKLNSCKYNRVDVLPTTLGSYITFPVLVVK